MDPASPSTRPIQLRARRMRKWTTETPSQPECGQIAQMSRPDRALPSETLGSKEPAPQGVGCVVTERGHVQSPRRASTRNRTSESRRSIESSSSATECSRAAHAVASGPYGAGRWRETQRGRAKPVLFDANLVSFGCEDSGKRRDAHGINAGN